MTPSVLACLTCATLLASCSDSIPAAPEDGGGGPSPPIDVGTGGLGGAGGTGGAGGMGGNDSIQCEELPSGTNRFTATLQGNDPFDFEPQVVFSAWQPRSCSSLRDFVLGFNANDECSDVPGEIFEIVIHEQWLGAIEATRTFSIAPSSPIPSKVRLYTNDDIGEQRVWGNCIGSSGILNFTSLGTDPESTNTVTLQSLMLTDCAANQSLPRLTVTGTIQIQGPPECDPPDGGVPNP